jgi:hypothetical protein
MNSLMQTAVYKLCTRIYTLFPAIYLGSEIHPAPRILKFKKKSIVDLSIWTARGFEFPDVTRGRIPLKQTSPL